MLDRKALRDEQDKRIFAANQVFLQMDQKKFLAAMEPLHFMRVIRDGKDIGFVQVNERLSTHNGHEGIEYIIHSRVETGLDQLTDAALALRQQPRFPNRTICLREMLGGNATGSLANNVVVPNALAPRRLIGQDRQTDESLH